MSLLAGSDHNKSQNNPEVGGSLKRLIDFKSFIVFKLGDSPPWIAKNLLFIIHDKGN